MRHSEEAALIPHYEKHVEYHSTITDNSVRRIYEMFSEHVDFAVNGSPSFLDLGCGTGKWLRFLVNEIPNSIGLGVDCSRNRIQKAISEGSNRINYYVGDINDIVRTAPPSQVASAFETFEHLVDPLQVIRDLSHRSQWLVGSVPLNHAYKAHLQVYESVEDVTERLGVNVISSDKKNAFFVKEL